MEIQCEDGSKIELVNGSKTLFGRGAGFNTKDRIVSRHHVTFELEKTINQTEPRVSFHVTGRNPVWVRNGRTEREVKVFRRFDKGEMAAGDWFCVSSETPVWFRLKERVAEGGEESFDLSKIDPVKEFGFLVIGHEFDCYPKQRIKSPKNWDWFLDEVEKDSEDDDDERKKKRGKGKRKKRVEGDDDDDDDWTGESEDDREIVAKARKVERTKYSIRSKERNKLPDDMIRKKNSGTISVRSNEEDDETLRGFIVDDDKEEEELGEGSDEEEEFIDDDFEEEELDD